ncbi:hypothetical protein [Microbacterium sp. CJ88]|uniref:hypothetical protein n=1 Tax=Microbacterium sp. CJ88 TaxID=3445672 RepID=UPI003F65DDDD
MPTRTLRNEFALPVPARAVFDHVREPASYVGLSPLVIAVTDVERRVDGFAYRAVERVPIIGRWHYDNPLRVTLLASGAGPFVVHGDVVSTGGITVEYRYDIADDGDGCRVVDLVTLRTPFGLAGFAARKAREVQLWRPATLAGRLS